MITVTFLTSKAIFGAKYCGACRRRDLEVVHLSCASTPQRKSQLMMQFARRFHSPLLLGCLNGDLPALFVRRKFRHNNAQNSVLQTSLHSILIDAAWEAEAAVELANGTLAHPILRLLLSRGNDILLRFSCNHRSLFGL